MLKFKPEHKSPGDKDNIGKIEKAKNIDKNFEVSEIWKTDYRMNNVINIDGLDILVRFGGEKDLAEKLHKTDSLKEAGLITLKYPKDDNHEHSAFSRFPIIPKINNEGLLVGYNFRKFFPVNNEDIDQTEDPEDPNFRYIVSNNIFYDIEESFIQEENPYKVKFETDIRSSIEELGDLYFIESTCCDLEVFISNEEGEISGTINLDKRGGDFKGDFMGINTNNSYTNFKLTVPSRGSKNSEELFNRVKKILDNAKISNNFNVKYYYGPYQSYSGEVLLSEISERPV